MSTRAKIFGVFLLIIAMGISFVIAGAIIVNRLAEQIIYQHNLHEEATAISGTATTHIAIMSVVTVILCLIIAVAISLWVGKKISWYENILDKIPFPLSITDNNRNWTFINKPVEDMLGVKRSEVIGKHCSNWGAAVCNTPECGLECLERGKTWSTFNQLNLDFRVDAAYLTDRNGKKTGHIEVVQDISELMETQKTQEKLVDGIRNSVVSFSHASRQISSTSEEVAKDATQNAEIISESVHVNSQRSNEQMNDMLRVMSEINEASQSIEKILDLINDIARQTNILALNASVEAARAGQQGASFAVVAEEVRTLAAKSTEAAKDTGALVSASIEKAALGSEIAKQVSESLRDIMDGFNKSAVIVGDIARISEEQSASLNEIDANVKSLEGLVEQFDSRG